MILTEQQAKGLIEAFGPCSTIYECSDETSLIEGAQEHSNLKEFADFLLDSESLWWGQRGEQWSGEDEEKFKAEVAADKLFLREMRDRVRAFVKGAL